MTQFFTTTLITKYIKYLLANTPIPQYSFISENQHMAVGCLYTYKNSILYCTKEGRFTGLNGTLKRVDHLYAQPDLRAADPYYKKYNTDNMYADKADYYNNSPEGWPEAPTFAQLSEGWMSVVNSDLNRLGDESPSRAQPLSATDDVVGVRVWSPAEFDIIETFLPTVYKPGITQQYVSNTSYYDSETHRWLGEYLRLLRNMYDLDLMSLYNCFNHKVVRDVVLRSDIVGNVLEVPNHKKKVLLIPIKFDRTYTVAIESDTPVQMCSVFYNNGVIMDAIGQRPLSYILEESLTNKNTTQFYQPFTYVSSAATTDTQKYERYLYLAIQVSQTNDSSVVVLEGDYSRGSSSRMVADIKGLRRGEATIERLSAMMTSDLSLLAVNDKVQRPFSDRLIEYLCGNTIDTREKIDENVEQVIEMLGGLDIEYKGQWTNELRYILYDRYMDLKNREYLHKRDILGFVDKDVENALRKGYLKQ